MNSQEISKRIARINRHVDLVKGFGFIILEQIDSFDFIENKTAFHCGLAARLNTHDNSKISIPEEFLYLSLSNKEIQALSQEEKIKMNEAILSHAKNNRHHPEFFENGIAGMNDIDLAEMVCDWKARSSEFGTDLRGFIKERAESRYHLNENKTQYEKILSFVDVVCPPAFKGSSV